MRKEEEEEEDEELLFYESWEDGDGDEEADAQQLLLLAPAAAVAAADSDEASSSSAARRGTKRKKSARSAKCLPCPVHDALVCRGLANRLCTHHLCSPCCRAKQLGQPPTPPHLLLFFSINLNYYLFDIFGLIF